MADMTQSRAVRASTSNIRDHSYYLDEFEEFLITHNFTGGQNEVTTKCLHDRSQTAEILNSLKVGFSWH